jgi:hypothetical protein
MSRYIVEELTNLVNKERRVHYQALSLFVANRSEMVAVLGPNEALPYHIHTYIFVANYPPQLTRRHKITVVSIRCIFRIK